jgi:aminopeptidase YwaD
MHSLVTSIRPYVGELRQRRLGASPLGALCVVLLSTGCGGRDRGVVVPEGLADTLPITMQHAGPAVAPGGIGGPNRSSRTGPARFVPELYSRFDQERAMGLAAFTDRYYREPASDGYERVVDRLVSELYTAGFGVEAGYGLEVKKSGLSHPSWTPDSGVIEFVSVDERGAPIQAIGVLAFDGPEAPERAMLPANAPGCEVLGTVADGLDALTQPGMILLTPERIRNVESAARERGAAAIISTHLMPYCIDPTGRNREQDAIFVDVVRPGTEMPSFYVSPRVATAIRNTTRVGGKVRLRAVVRFAVRPLRTVIATIEGAERPDEVVHLVAHIDGAGANDNASGLGALVEGALLMKRLVDAKILPRPRRSLAFVFGREAHAADEALQDTQRTVVAAVVANMIGQSREQTGAICLLERGWDPAAIVALLPDEHTPYGAGSVPEEEIFGNGLAIVMRQALVDVAQHEGAQEGGAEPWETREHPWEGGSDHDTYLAHGVAACLLWHFTDFSFATSLDRMAHVDADELRRTAVAALAGALAVADARPTDLDRHLATLNLERQMRLDAVVRAEAGEPQLQRWKTWFDQARFWLQAVCLGDPLPSRAGAETQAPGTKPDTEPAAEPETKETP